MSASTASDDTVDVGMALADLRRQWWVAAVLSALGLALGLLAAARYSGAATAASSVVVAPISTNPASTSAPTLRDVSMMTETRVVTSGVVAALAAQRLGGTVNPQSLLTGLHATSPANSVVLHITCTRASPEAAANCANAFADAYLAYRADLAVQRNRSVAAGLDARVLQLQGQVADLAAGPAGQDAAALEQRGRLLQEVSDLRVRSSQLTAAPVLAGTVVTRATVPALGGVRRVLTMAVGGGLVGALAGVVLALARERRGDRLVDVPDLEEQVQAPALAVLPQAGRGAAPRPALLRDPAGDAAEGVRVLATKLDAPTVRLGLTSLLVAGEPRPRAATDLALAFAARGYDTALVAPATVLEGLRQVPPGGVPDVEGDVLAVPGLAGLALVTLQTGDLGAGRAAPGVRAVRRAAEAHQRVVVDGTGLPASQVLALGAAVDGAVLVSRQRSSRRAALRALADDLRLVEVPVLGAVMVTRRRARAGGALPLPPRPGSAGAPETQDVPEPVEEKVGW